MADELAKLRAELNIGAIDTPNFIKAIQAAYQNMPGAGVAQAGLAAGSDLLGGLAGNLYGVGKQALSGQLGNPQAGNQAYADAQQVAQALHYNPPTQAGQDIYNAYNKVGEVTGPLPELWNTRIRFTPDDLRVAGRTVTQDIRNFPSDYTNAQAGITRDYSTLGSRAAGATDTFGQAIRPLAETINNQVMETGGIKMPMGMPDIPVAQFAVKTGGGNYPTNMGSTNPLVEQGKFGRHLSESQISDPIKAFEKTLESHYPGHDNRKYALERDWKEFEKEYAQARTPGVGYELTPELAKQAADVFARDFNAKLEPNEKPLLSVSDIERVAPHFNTWNMSPYQNYITRQMGTGLSTDPYLQQANEANIPLNNLFRLGEQSGDDEVTQDAARRRDQFLRIQQMNPNFDLNAPQNINVGKQTATTPAGIQLEDYLDKTLYPSKASYMNKDMFPALSKIPEDALVTDFLSAEPWKQTGLPAIQDKVLRDLVANKIDPNKISALTPAVVLKQIIEDYKKEQEAISKTKEAVDSYRIARNKELPVDLTYDDGSQMVVFTKADYDKDPIMLTRDLSQITKDLQQCIGAGCHNIGDYQGMHGPVLEPHTGKAPKGSKGVFTYASYFEGLKNGTREIASLKNPDGVAEFTANIMVRGNDFLGTPTTHKGFVRNWIENEILSGKENRDNWQPILDNLDKNNNTYLHSVLESTPELKDAFYKHFLPKPEKYITEMKGYKNEEIADKYIPKVKEWLNKEAANLGGVTMDQLEGEIFDLKNVHSANNVLSDKHQNWSSVAIENLLIDARDNNLLPRFFDDKDFEKLAGDRQVDLTEDPIHTNRHSSPTLEKAYQEVSQQIVDTFTDTYVRDAFANNDNPALNGIIREIEERPQGYGLGNYSPAIRQQVIERLREEAGRSNELNQIADGIQGMEPEQARGWPPERLTELQADVLEQNIQNYFAGNEYVVPEDMVEPYATNTRILMGSQNPEARLPEQYHRDIVDALLNQDEHTDTIRYIIDTLQGPGYFPAIPELTARQLENILNIVISWTERYPLAE